MSGEKVSTSEAIPDSRDLIADAKSTLKDLITSKNPDQILTAEEARIIDTIIDVVEGVGFQRGSSIDGAAAYEEPSREHLPYAYPT